MEVDWDAMWVEREVVCGDPVESVITMCAHNETYRDQVRGDIVCMCCGVIVDSVLEDVFGNNIPSKNKKPPSL